MSLGSLSFPTSAEVTPNLQMLMEWATHLSWKMKPLRAVGPKTWVIESPSSPPASQLYFNTMPILVRELNPRFVAKQNPVVAGPKPSSAISAPGSSGIFANGLGGNDPWANWSGTSANTGQPPRAAAAGPIEDKFAKQTSRMDKLEAELTQIKQDQKEQKESQAKFQQDVVAGDQENRKDLDQKIVGLKQEFENSFTKALATQTKKFDNDLQEIKQLLLGSAKRKEHPDTMMT